MARKCIHCGEEIEEVDAKFCTECGQPLEPPPVEVDKRVTPLFRPFPWRWEFVVKDKDDLIRQLRIPGVILLAILFVFTCGGYACGVRVSSGGGIGSERVVYKSQEIPVTVIVTPTPEPGPTRTPTPIPTDTPSPTPTPTPTPLPTTEPGTVLDPGQTWVEDGLALRLDFVTRRTDGIVVDMKLENIGNEARLFAITRHEIRMVTDTGDIVHPRHHLEQLRDGFSGGQLDFQPGDSFQIAKDGVFWYDLVSNSDVDEVIVEVTGLSKIDRAQWRIPIQR